MLPINMNKIQLIIFSPIITEQGINERSLRFLNVQDIENLFDKVGPRAIFRDKLRVRFFTVKIFCLHIITVQTLDYICIAYQML